MTCQTCKRLENCMTSYEECKHVDVLFVQDARRTTSGSGFATAIQEMLRKDTHPIRSSMSVGFTSLCQFPIPKDVSPNKSDVRQCRVMFDAMIDKCKPIWIVGLGASVFGELSGKDKFSSWVGRVIDYKDGVRFIPVYHPAYALKSKQRQREYEMQIKTVLQTIKNGESKKFDTSGYALIRDEDEICDVLRELTKGTGVQAYDYETTGLSPAAGLPVCISISDAKGVAYCFYFFDIDEYRAHKTNSSLTPRIRKAVAEWLSSPVKKTAQNAKFEDGWSMFHFGVEPANIVGDTKQMFHLLHEEALSNLTALAYQYTDMGGYDAPMQDFLDKGHEHWEATPEFMLPYAAGDADCTRRVYMQLRTLIDKDDGLRWLELNVVNPAIRTLARIEMRGMYVNWEKVTSVKKKLTDETKRLNMQLSSSEGIRLTEAHFRKKNPKYEGVNLNSAPQVQYLLYTALRMPVTKVSKKTGQASASSKVLEEMRKKHPVVDSIVRIRSYAHQLGEIEVMEQKRRKDDTIYSDLVQGYVVTGRLASRSPNLQNIKGGTDEEPSYVKECFESRFAEKGMIVQADYKNLELRLIGGESGEPAFIDAFARDMDMHSVTASKIYKIDLQEFLDNKEQYKTQRVVGKRINFGTVYGITEHGLSVQLDCSEEEAKASLDAYWDIYPKVRSWMEGNVHEARTTGQVVNRLGRIRRLPDIASDKWWVRESNERIASNTKIQSLGADITMWVMSNVDNELIRRKAKSVLIGQVHDSLVVDAHKSEIALVKEVLRYVMVDKAMKLFSFLKIPIDIDIEGGSTWANLKKL